MGNQHDKEPWKEILAELWRKATTGRKWLAVSLVLLIVVTPGVFGLVAFYASTFKTLSSMFSPKTSTLSKDEENLRNEWVSVVAYFPSEQAAREQHTLFKALYEKYETLQREGANGPYALWRDDIVVARDPEISGRWIIAVDMFYGSSSAPVVSAELARVARLGDPDSEAQNTYQRMFVSSKVLCYSQRIFEKTYGGIDPTPIQKRDPKGIPYVPCDGSDT